MLAYNILLEIKNYWICCVITIKQLYAHQHMIDLDFFCFLVMGLSANPLLYKPFTGITVKAFDDVCKKAITKRCDKQEMQRLLKRVKR
jgi:hypothetical protein